MHNDGSQERSHSHLFIHSSNEMRVITMIPLDLSVCLVAGYSIISLLLCFCSIHYFDLPNVEPSWADAVGVSGLAASNPDQLEKKDITTPSTPLSTRFFPTYGTQKFLQQCGWAARRTNIHRNCTFLVRPPTDMEEGISHWISQVVSGHHYAQQTGCSLYFDYGPNIDIQQVVTPFPSRTTFIPLIGLCLLPSIATAHSLHRASCQGPHTPYWTV